MGINTLLTNYMAKAPKPVKNAYTTTVLLSGLALSACGGGGSTGSSSGEVLAGVDSLTSKTGQKRVYTLDYTNLPATCKIGNVVFYFGDGANRVSTATEDMKSTYEHIFTKPSEPGNPFIGYGSVECVNDKYVDSNKLEMVVSQSEGNEKPPTTTPPTTPTPKPPPPPPGDGGDGDTGDGDEGDGGTGGGDDTEV